MDEDSSNQWATAEVGLLLSIWGEESVQAKINGTYRNKAVFEEIASSMAENGYRRTWLQCQRKIKALKGKYKEAKDHNNKSGNSRVVCPFYDEIEKILGDKPSCQPLEIIDSSSTSMEEEGIDDTTVILSSATAPSTDTTSSETSSASSVANEGTSRASTPTPGTSRASTPTPGTGQQEPSGAGLSKTRKKRKNKMDSTMETFGEKVKECLAQTDDTELQLQLQAAQHAHEFRMMTMFTQFLAGRASQQPHQMPPVHTYATQSSSYPDHVHPPRFGQDYVRSTPFHQEYGRPAPFYQDHTRPNPNDAHPFPPMYQDYASAGPSHQAQVHSQPFAPAQSSSPQPLSPQPFQDDLSD